ncbi:MAG: patatin-like phospholipase family protein [Gemmatimonadaceae bacterium]|nr:patatin-like phospholipase family protein [Gemmatimonadaceae bacterium]
MPSALTLRAGPRALALIRERGLRLDDVDIFPGASGGAKWLAIAGLDRYLFGTFLRQPSTDASASASAPARVRPLHCIGSSIGSWRMACLAQRDPVAALARGHHAYIYTQRYSPKPGPREVTQVLTRCLDDILGAHGVDEILSHPFARLHIITAQGRGLATSQRRLVLATSIALAVTANLVQRRSLSLQFRRTVFHGEGDTSPFAQLRDLPTTHRALTRDNLRDALIASGSIPLLVEGGRIAGRPGEVHWDGGVLDYHLDLDFGSGDGLVLYPHFYPHVVPGWFDKSLPWRRARAKNFERALLIAPSPEFVASLPGGKIPDRRDFHAFPSEERERRWQTVLDASAQLGDELHELIATGRVAEHIHPW